MPVAHLLWSGVWAGIAAAAADRARAFVRMATRRAEGTLPPGAAHLTRADASMRRLRSLITGAAQRFESAADDPVALEFSRVPDQPESLQGERLGAGAGDRHERDAGLWIAGYRNDGDFCVGRHLRDMLSSPIMISNDRILANLGNGLDVGRRAGFLTRLGVWATGSLTARFGAHS